MSKNSVEFEHNELIQIDWSENYPDYLERMKAVSAWTWFQYLAMTEGE